MLGFSFRKKKKELPKIFIIEDSKTFLQMLKLKLKSLYKKTAIIKGFTESSTFLDEVSEGVDVIIMDLYLDDDSEVDGLDLLKKIKEQMDDTFVLVLTNEEDVEIAKKCFALGANSYMVKSAESIDKIIDEIHYKVGLSQLSWSINQIQALNVQQIVFSHGSEWRHLAVGNTTLFQKENIFWKSCNLLLERNVKEVVKVKLGVQIDKATL